MIIRRRSAIASAGFFATVLLLEGLAIHGQEPGYFESPELLGALDFDGACRRVTQAFYRHQLGEERIGTGHQHLRYVGGAIEVDEETANASQPLASFTARFHD